MLFSIQLLIQNGETENSQSGTCNSLSYQENERIETNQSEDYDDIIIDQRNDGIHTAENEAYELTHERNVNDSIATTTNEAYEMTSESIQITANTAYDSINETTTAL